MDLRTTFLSLTVLPFGIIPVHELASQIPRRGGVELDIPFVDGGGHDQQLDSYTPSNTGFPTILFVHEGSLTSGDRKDEPYARMCQTFEAAGIAPLDELINRQHAEHATGLPARWDHRGMRKKQRA